ncbi:hypothetical protein [Rufibacter soli]
MDSLPPHVVQLALDSLERQQLTPTKTGLFSRIFGGGGKVKYKNAVINVNQQTATGGSTIGANSQAGNDESKVKGSAVSNATVANTAGQGGTASGDATATATNTTKKKDWTAVLLEYGLWIGAALFVVFAVWKRSLNPLKWG